MSEKRRDYELMLSAGDKKTVDTAHDCSCTELFGGRCDDCSCVAEPAQGGVEHHDERAAPRLVSDTERLYRIISMMDIQRMLARKIRH